jgi:hypothetical protein
MIKIEHLLFIVTISVLSSCGLIHPKKSIRLKLVNQNGNDKVYYNDQLNLWISIPNDSLVVVNLSNSELSLYRNSCSDSSTIIGTSLRLNSIISADSGVTVSPGISSAHLTGTYVPYYIPIGYLFLYDSNQILDTVIFNNADSLKLGYRR